jgi:quercetin dioxygenase-like cupin family protein
MTMVRDLTDPKQVTAETPLSDDNLSVMKGVIPPGVSVPLHSHADVEAFYVVAGEAQLFSGKANRWIAANAGQFAYIPGHEKHAWRNTSGKEVTMLVISTATIAKFFQQPACGPVTPATVAQTLAALIPENAIIVDESISFAFAFYPGTHAAAPHDWLQHTGGAIGLGLPLATGAAIAAPGRRVINLEGDGSALYTVQALWTQARERLDVTTVILSNRRYAILELEFGRVDANPGSAALDLFDLKNPALDWIRLATGLGVEAARAQTLEDFADLLAVSCRRKGPFLIELIV